MLLKLHGSIKTGIRLSASQRSNCNYSIFTSLIMVIYLIGSCSIQVTEGHTIWDRKLFKTSLYSLTLMEAIWLEFFSFLYFSVSLFKCHDPCNLVFCVFCGQPGILIIIKVYFFFFFVCFQFTAELWQLQGQQLFTLKYCLKPSPLNYYLYMVIIQRKLRRSVEFNILKLCIYCWGTAPHQHTSIMSHFVT